MEKSALIHKSDSIYSFPLNENEIELRLLTKKDDDILKVELMYNDKYKFHEKVYLKEIYKKYSDAVYDYYIEIVKLKDLRFAYVFKITTQDYKEYYFSESGITTQYDITKGFYDFFQVSYINELDLVQKSSLIQNRVFYQIFVDRFYKSEDNKNSRINIPWGAPVTQHSLAGGNLKGICQKINYLKDLGIDALYLTPIFESDSNHKYNIKDYFTIAKDFGNEEDLKALVEEAHRNQMIIVLDGVFNHISKDNELFLDVMEKGRASTYFHWFFIHGDDLDLKSNNYERFADDLGMPRLNLNHPEVEAYIIQVCLHYVEEYDIDGLRLDVSDEIPHRFWIRLKEKILQRKKDFIFIGENWHNAHSFLNSGYEFDSIMNYSITKEVLNYVAWGNYTAFEFKNHIISNLMRYKSNVNYNMFNLLSSHDVHRFYTECKKDEDLFLLGYAFIFMHIGVPCIYYGDEIGLEGNYDPDNRRCFLWEEEQWNKRIHKKIKGLISIHKKYRINEMEYSIDVIHEMICLTRQKMGRVLKLYMNLSEKSHFIKETEIVLENQYKDNILYPKGFVIIREEKNS